MDVIKIGDKVKFICEEAHTEMPTWYPPVGTVGNVIEVDDEDPNDIGIHVAWPEDCGVAPSGKNVYEWWCNLKNVEIVPVTFSEAIRKMTDEEIAHTLHAIYNMGWIDGFDGPNDEAWVCNVLPTLPYETANKELKTRQERCKDW